VPGATVNKETGGGKKSGSGRGEPEKHVPSRKGGRLGRGASLATRRRSIGVGPERRDDRKRKADEFALFCTQRPAAL
jgi:hypothetical protein